MGISPKSKVGNRNFKMLFNQRLMVFTFFYIALLPKNPITYIDSRIPNPNCSRLGLLYSHYCLCFPRQDMLTFARKITQRVLGPPVKPKFLIILGK
jgi:hypothetical protein